MIDKLELTVNELENKLDDAANIAEQMTSEINTIKLDRSVPPELLQMCAKNLRYLRHYEE